MTGRQSAWWKWFAAGAVLVVLALAWVTSEVLALERSEFAARADARRQEVLRLALWRMDSWVGPRLARESARPYFEYLSYYPQERAYTRMLTPIEEGAVLTPSPLLTFREPFITLHFQIDSAGQLSSPQVPTSNHRDLAESTLLTSEEIRSCGTALDHIASILDVPAIRAQVEAAEQALAMTPEVPAQTLPLQQVVGRDYQKAQTDWSLVEQTKRQARNAESNEAYQQGAQQFGKGAPAQQLDAGPDLLPLAFEKSDTVQVGPFVPLWVTDSAPQSALIYLRQIHVGRDHHLQGFLVDWPHLRATLLEEVADLMPDADLLPRIAPLDAASAAPSVNLATVPVIVSGLPPVVASLSGLTPTRLALLIVWSVVLLALSAGGMMLHASLLYGQRRSDFASAVTHELRTPLTTFRLYSEMLADNMVPDPSRRREYLETLRSESSRLARLVENVLAYARLEEGRQHTSPQRIKVKALLDEVLPLLARQSAEHEMQFTVASDIDDDQTIHADRDSVSRILTNLVDNSCKYANGSANRSIDLRISRAGNRVLMNLRDHGPGIDGDTARRLFAPFRRGRRAGEEMTAGVGLGLALCRSLARDMGGDLRHAALPSREVGACFVLEIPIDPSKS